MFAPRTYTSILSVLFFLVILVAASPAPAPWGGGVPTKTITVTETPAPTGGSGSGNCNTGPIQCCNESAQSGTANAARILAAAGIAAQGVTGIVGAGCSPITVIGTGSGANWLVYLISLAHCLLAYFLIFL